MYQKMISRLKNPAKSKFGGSLSVSSKQGSQNVRPLSLGGFTLIELLVVVLIIGILAAIALPKYEIAVEKSRAAEPLAVLRSLRDAQEVYYMANGVYATDPEVLAVTIPSQSKYWEYYVRGWAGVFAEHKTKGYLLGFRWQNQDDGETRGRIVCGYDKPEEKEFAEKICPALGSVKKEGDNRWVLFQ